MYVMYMVVSMHNRCFFALGMVLGLLIYLKCNLLTFVQNNIHGKQPAFRGS